MQVIVFEDGGVGRLCPITTARAAYTISCAGYRLIDWLRRLDVPLRAVVRRHLFDLERTDRGELFPPAAESPAGGALLVNARLVPSRSTFDALRKLLPGQNAGVAKSGESILAARLPPDVTVPSKLAAEEIESFFEFAGLSSAAPLALELPLFEYPHDVVRHHLASFSENLADRLEQGSFREVADGVFAAEGATLGEHTVTSTKHGPVLLERGATIGPHCYLSGPALIGSGARVIEHSAIKDAVALGHTTKIGGEVEASVIEPYTNKQHHGFLGHSYLGSWINLGAGTCNSDLKNTYGAVNMEYRGEKVATGMQFLGCVMGDYAKSAINTGIFTGKTIGVCSMVYGFVTTNVPSFVNYARLFGQVTELPPEVMVATQARMFARRNVQQRECDARLIHDMYELTRDERQLAGEPLAL